MTRKEYNGWTNYETWLVNLWLSNDEGLASSTRVQAQEAWEDEGGREVDASHYARLCLEGRLKDWIEESQPELEGFWQDLMGAALSEVDWLEIADHWLADEELEGYERREVQA